LRVVKGAYKYASLGWLQCPRFAALPEIEQRLRDPKGCANASIYAAGNPIRAVVPRPVNPKGHIAFYVLQVVQCYIALQRYIG